MSIRIQKCGKLLNSVSKFIVLIILLDKKTLYIQSYLNHGSSVLHMTYMQKKYLLNIVVPKYKSDVHPFLTLFYPSIACSRIHTWKKYLENVDLRYLIIFYTVLPKHSLLQYSYIEKYFAECA